ncbi:hypothetical protein BGW39_008847 [Mortierella sp. 14UC]|nr:hypothetical protein BGW39_008847 [Mortierella sp. 14UC]
MIPMGFYNSYGVFQEYYLAESFKGTASVFQISWIGTLTMISMDIFGPFTGFLCDYIGHRPAALFGVTIMTLSLVLAAFATQVWHLYLTQGLLYARSQLHVFRGNDITNSMVHKASRPGHGDHV